MQHDADWIVQGYIGRKRGITITGPDPKTLIAPVSPADLRRAVSVILHTWLRQFLEDTDCPKSRYYQVYTALTICRILYMYGHGEIVSKRTTAEWAKQTL